MRKMILNLLLIFITTFTSAEDINRISESDASEINNMTYSENSVCGFNQKHEINNPTSRNSKKMKNITLNEFDENHKYFNNLLNEDQLEPINEEKWINIFKIGS